MELVISEENKKLYRKMKSKLNKLKNLISNAQIWLQIVERSIYQPAYVDIMEKCYKKLLKIEILFRTGGTSSLK